MTLGRRHATFLAALAFAARDTDLATGKPLQTTTLLVLRANPPVDDRLFQIP